MALTLPHTFGTAQPSPPEPMQFLDDNFNALLNAINAVTTGAPIPIVNAQTGTSYTIAATDLGKLVTFSNAGAIAVTLPQGTGAFGAPFFLYVSCLRSSTGSATITPTTSTIDGLTSLVLQPGGGAMIVTDGSGNYQVEHYTVGGQLTPGTTNTLNPYTQSTTQAVAHGLSASPTHLDVYLQNLSAELGYSIGDRIFGYVTPNASYNAAANATDSIIITNSNAVQVIRQDTNVNADITLTKWELVVIPYAFV